MALQKSITLKSNFGDDVTFNTAYIKVDSIEGNKTELRVNVVFQKSINELVVNRKSYLFVPALDGKNFIAQSYDYLKTLPEFAGSMDC